MNRKIIILTLPLFLFFINTYSSNTGFQECQWYFAGSSIELDGKLVGDNINLFKDGINIDIEVLVCEMNSKEFDLRGQLTTENNAITSEDGINKVNNVIPDSMEVTGTYTSGPESFVHQNTIYTSGAVNSNQGITTDSTGNIINTSPYTHIANTIRFLDEIVLNQLTSEISYNGNLIGYAGSVLDLKIIGNELYAIFETPTFKKFALNGTPPTGQLIPGPVSNLPVSDITSIDGNIVATIKDYANGNVMLYIYNNGAWTLTETVSITNNNLNIVGGVRQTPDGTVFIATGQIGVGTKIMVKDGTTWKTIFTTTTGSTAADKITDFEVIEGANGEKVAVLSYQNGLNQVLEEVIIPIDIVSINNIPIGLTNGHKWTPQLSDFQTINGIAVDFEFDNSIPGAIVTNGGKSLSITLNSTYKVRTAKMVNGNLTWGNYYDVQLQKLNNEQVINLINPQIQVETINGFQTSSVKNNIPQPILSDSLEVDTVINVLNYTINNGLLELEINNLNNKATVIYKDTLTGVENPLDIHTITIEDNGSNFAFANLNLDSAIQIIGQGNLLVTSTTTTFIAAKIFYTIEQPSLNISKQYSYDGIENDKTQISLTTNSFPLKTNGNELKTAGFQIGENTIIKQYLEINDTIYQHSEINGSITNTEKLNIKVSDLKVYPNPIEKGQNLVIENIPNSVNQVNLFLYDLNGRLLKILEQQTISSQIQVDLRDLAKGKYLIKISFEEPSKQYEVTKIIIIE